MNVDVGRIGLRAGKDRGLKPRFADMARDDLGPPILCKPASVTMSAFFAPSDLARAPVSRAQPGPIRVTQGMKKLSVRSALLRLLMSSPGCVGASRVEPPVMPGNENARSIPSRRKAAR
ncbi:hypothetical protein Y027_3364 [Burkholderia pseudomallei TSV5]|nr:hypothetical protein BURPS1655_A1667 [Burkholderia pseudomallei 1655]KGD28246.1 hypothetical protein DP59_3027 [Burkholderia pseudomallei]KGS23110.1 hypothetical protein X989_2791 [Burkholderia pseudomallei MSHR4378]KGX57700.1 hypothetical protein Y027_3364 [Burkholderia pseudomallei TSV5]